MENRSVKNRTSGSNGRTENVEFRDLLPDLRTRPAFVRFPVLKGKRRRRTSTGRLTYVIIIILPQV